MTTHRRPLESVLETVGETPLVRVHAAPDDVPIYAKLESFNPGASVKDRIGRYMLEQILERGQVAPGGTLIEPTAGNTGIGLALAAGQLDLGAVFVVPERFSVEKQQLMRALGAEVINTPAEDGMSRAVERAHELAEELDDAVVPQQFENPLNVEAHYALTGPEIYDALGGAVGAIVAGCGTSGTLMGVAEYALEQDPATHIVAVEPQGSMYTAFLGEDPTEAEYKTDGIEQVADVAAQAEVKRLAREEGQLVGSSAGAASVGAQRIADRIADGSLEVPSEAIVTVFPDSSERYLSKGLYGEFDDWTA
jgi:cysteine synthase A